LGLLVWNLADDEVEVLYRGYLIVHDMVEEMVPKHLMLLKVFDVLEVIP
jgi:hypothetical protein